MTAVLEREVTVPDPPEDTPSPAPGRCLAGGRPHRVTDEAGQPIPGHLCDRHFEQLRTMLREVEREALPYQITESGKWLTNLDPVPSMAVAWDRGGGTLASQQAPLRLDMVLLTDPRTSTWGARLVGPYCAHCTHGSCVVRRGADEDRDSGSANAVNPLDVLTNYACRVRDELSLTYPTRRVITRAPRWGEVCDRACQHPACAAAWTTREEPVPATIRSERKVLTRHMEWIAQQPWAGDLYRDVREVRDRLRLANGTQPDDPLPGRCPNIVDGVECGGPLWPVKPKHTSGEDVWTGASPSAIRCSACTRRWEGPSEVARLVLMVEQARTTRDRS